MACSGRFATADDYNEIWRANLDLLDPDILDEVERALNFYAAAIHTAMAAADACECSLSDWATNYLKQLNVIGAAVVFKVSCGPSLTDELRETYIDWVTERIEDIRSMAVDLCGDTSKDYPAVDLIPIAYTGFDQERIIDNYIRRNS